MNVLSSPGYTPPSAAFSPANEIHVATNGLDTNAGTVGAPFLTLNGALASISAGSPRTIIVHAGGYAADVTITKPNLSFILNKGAVVGGGGRVITYTAPAGNLRWGGGGQLSGTINDSSIGNVNYNNVNLTGNVMNMPTAGYREFRNVDGDACTINVNHAAAQVLVEWSKSMGTVNVSAGLASINGVATLAAPTHTGGALLVDNSMIVMDGSGRCVNSSAAASATSLLLLGAGVNLLQASGARGLINKTGNCPYVLAPIIRTIASDVLTGTPIGMVSARDILASHSAVNYSASSAFVDGHFDGIDTALGERPPLIRVAGTPTALSAPATSDRQLAVDTSTVPELVYRWDTATAVYKPVGGAASPLNEPLGSALGTFDAGTGLITAVTADGTSYGYVVGGAVGATPLIISPLESYFTASVGGAFLTVAYAVGDYVVVKDDGNSNLIWVKLAAQSGLVLPGTLLVTAMARLAGSSVGSPIYVTAGSFAIGDNIMILFSVFNNGVLYQAGAVLTVVTPFTIPGWQLDAIGAPYSLYPYLANVRYVDLATLRGKMMLAPTDISFAAATSSGAVFQPTPNTLYSFNVAAQSWVAVGQRSFTNFSQKRFNYVPDPSSTTPSKGSGLMSGAVASGTAPSGPATGTGVSSLTVKKSDNPAAVLSGDYSRSFGAVVAGQYYGSQSFVLEPADYSQVMDLSFSMKITSGLANLTLSGNPATNTFGLWVVAVATVGGAVTWIPAANTMAVSIVQGRIRTSFQALEVSATYFVAIIVARAPVGAYTMSLDDFDVSAAQTTPLPGAITVKVYLTSSQASAAHATSTIGNCTATRNDLSAWSGNAFTAPVSGEWLITAFVGQVTNGAGLLGYQINGGGTLYWGDSSSINRLGFADKATLVAGDVVRFLVYTDVDNTFMPGATNTRFTFTLDQSSALASSPVAAVGAIAYMTGGYTPPGGAEVLLTGAPWATSRNDLGAFAGGYYTVQSPGWYQINETVGSNSTGVYAAIGINGAVQIGGGTSASSNRGHASMAVYLAAGDRIQPACYNGGQLLFSVNFSVVKLPDAFQAGGARSRVIAQYSANLGQVVNNGSPVANYNNRITDNFDCVTTGAAWLFTAKFPDHYTVSLTFRAIDTTALAAGNAASSTLYKVSATNVETAITSLGECENSRNRPAWTGTATVFLNAGESLRVRIFSEVALTMANFLTVGGSNVITVTSLNGQ